MMKKSKNILFEKGIIIVNLKSELHLPSLALKVKLLFSSIIYKLIETIIL